MNNEPEQQELDSNWQSLLDAFELGLIEEPKKLIREYRLYYNEEGDIIQVSDSNWNHPQSGSYVVVDEAIHKNWIQYWVKNGRAELKPTDPTSVTQLKKSNEGYKVAANNPAILLEAKDTLSNTEHYARRNN